MSNTIKKELKWLKNFLKIWRNSRKIHTKRIYLVGTPTYGNLGDQAIALAEYKYLKDVNYPGKIVEIPSLYIARHTFLFKMIIGKSDILVTGGGFMGTLWPKEENMIRSVVKNFNKNKVVILPQTVYFEDTQLGIDEKKKTKQIYGKHKRLYWFLRETTSYALVREMLPNANVFLCPDMALLLKPVNGTKKDRNDILMCLRSDKEKKLQEQDIDQIKEMIKKYYPNEKFRDTDTVLNKNVWLSERNHKVYKKIKEFANAKLIVTDRLHGMVFAALAGTPCIVCGNVNYKVKGIYQWIKNNEFIRYVEDMPEIEKTVRELSQIKSSAYDNSLIKEKYLTLEDVIFGRL